MHETPPSRSLLRLLQWSAKELAQALQPLVQPLLQTFPHEIVLAPVDVLDDVREHVLPALHRTRMRGLLPGGPNAPHALEESCRCLQRGTVSELHPECHDAMRSAAGGHRFEDVKDALESVLLLLRLVSLLSR